MRVYEARIEFTPTLWEVETTKLETPEKVQAYLGDVMETYPHQETFWVIFLTTRHHPIGRHLVSLGTATSTLASPSEIFRAAILSGATRIVVAHNHPSGDPTPSTADLTVTRQLRDASRIIGIELLDHVILGRRELDPTGRGFYSFRSNGII